MKERKKAGHLLGATILERSDGCIVGGHLQEDLRGTHYTGEARDFSNSPIFTSWLERVEYVEHADTTVIYTRNSIYFAAGNILEDAFGEGVTYAEGKSEMKDLFVKNLASQKPEVEDNVTYQLTKAGAELTGESDGAYIVTADGFQNHHLCAPNEVAMSLAEHKGTEDLQEVFFLKSKDFSRASMPLKESV